MSHPLRDTAQTAAWHVRRLAIRSYASATLASGLDARSVGRLGPAGLLVLNLHSVGPTRRSFSDRLAPETLDDFLSWLARHCRIVTFEDGEPPGRAADERPSAVLSFDDGYRDFLEYAMPTLDRHGIRAVVNVIPTCVDTGLPPWNVRLLDLLEQLPAQRFEKIALPGRRAVPPGSRDHARVRYGVELSRYLKMRPHDERVALVAQLLAQLDDLDERQVRPMLSRRDVAEVARHHEIGMHSYEHDSMEFESDELFRTDVERCLAWGSKHVGVRPSVYAFPNDSHRATQIAIAHEAGFRHVLLGGEHASRLGARAHPRITVYGRNSAEVRARVARAARATPGLPAATDRVPRGVPARSAADLRADVEA